jgi:peptidyl-prolyl cis-trans isomerase SurA
VSVRGKVGLIAGLMLLPALARAQTTVPLDRIIAVVGDHPILASEVEERFLVSAQQGQIPTDSAARTALRARILQQMITEELEVQQALHDTTIKVTDQEVQDQVAQQVKAVHTQIPDPNEFLRQLHIVGFKTEEEWRRKVGEDQRRQILVSRLLENLRQNDKLRPIPPNDAQMRAFWDEHKSEVGKRPANVSYRQIVILPHPDSTARAVALHLADSLVTALRGGADFPTVARKFSGDSISAAQGGELGWFRRGVMVKPFEDAAFRMRPGDLSLPVETKFGFHIIQVERVQPAEVLARHILIVPAISAAQIQKARALADSVHSLWVSGAVSFDTLAARFSDPDEQKLVENEPLAQAQSPIATEYVQAVTQDTTLGIKPVIVVGANSGRPKFAIIDVTGRQAEGDVTFEDVKETVKTRLSQDLAEAHYVDQLRRATYVDVRH